MRFNATGKILGVFFALTVLMALAGGASAADKEMKIGYADLSRLFDEYHKTKDYDKVLEGKNTEFEKQKNAKIEKIREAQGKLGLLTDDKKAALEQEIEQLKADLLEFDKQQKQDLAKERNEKIREILLEIEKIISTYAEQEGYSVILNDRVMLFGSESMNVTEPILKNLNPADKK